jgi:hypothetical protein
MAIVAGLLLAAGWATAASINQLLRGAVWLSLAYRAASKLGMGRALSNDRRSSITLRSAHLVVDHGARASPAARAETAPLQLSSGARHEAAA